MTDVEQLEPSRQRRRRACERRSPSGSWASATRWTACSPRCSAGGHALLVGVPGLAKTLLVSTVAEALAPLVQPGAVHPRPDAGRHHRHRAGRGGPRHRQAVVPVRARADLRAGGARRRDQPHAAQDAGGAAAGDAGASCDGRGTDLSAAESRSSCSPPRIRSSRKAPIRCPRRSSIASCSSCDWAIRRAAKRKRSSRRPPECGWQR